MHFHKTSSNANTFHSVKCILKSRNWRSLVNLGSYLDVGVRLRKCTICPSCSWVTHQYQTAKRTLFGPRHVSKMVYSWGYNYTPSVANSAFLASGQYRGRNCVSWKRGEKDILKGPRIMPSSIERTAVRFREMIWITICCARKLFGKIPDRLRPPSRFPDYRQTHTQKRNNHPSIGKPICYFVFTPTKRRVGVMNWRFEHVWRRMNCSLVCFRPTSSVPSSRLRGSVPMRRWQLGPSDKW